MAVLSKSLEPPNLKRHQFPEPSGSTIFPENAKQSNTDHSTPSTLRVILIAVYPTPPTIFDHY